MRSDETVTFRLRTDEKRLLRYLSDIEGCSQADLLRTLILQRALEKGIDSIPEASTQKRRGKPSTKRSPWDMSAVSWIPVPDAPPEPIVQTSSATTSVSRSLSMEPPSAIRTFGDLVAAFQHHSGTRGERVQKELDDTVRFVTGRGDGLTMLPLTQELCSLNSTMLDELREQIRDFDLRFPIKNLYLTYLRMIFNYALQKHSLDIQIDPAIDLRSLTAREVADAFPAPVRNE